MTLLDLRQFVKALRELEGVNWFLGDTTPLVHKTNVMFSLYCYSDEGNLVHTIPYIEEREAGTVPGDIIRSIASARLLCGVNSSFLHQKPLKNKPPKMQQYTTARQAWVDARMFDFIANNS